MLTLRTKQPTRKWVSTLEQLAGLKPTLFTSRQLSALAQDLSEGAFKTRLSRAVTDGHILRVCRGLYMCKNVAAPNGLFLFYAAAQLRPNQFNYVSLETVLSDAGVISQIPIQTITVMSSGRSNTISIGQWGVIEFVHTAQKPNTIAKHLYYDASIHMWRARVPQALRDMRATHRSLDLVDWSIANELI